MEQNIISTCNQHKNINEIFHILFLAKSSKSGVYFIFIPHLKFRLATFQMLTTACD